MDFITSNQLRFAAKLTTLTCALSVGIIFPETVSAASSERQYNNVTPTVLQCILTAGEQRTEGLESGKKINYEPESNNPYIGKVNIPSVLGPIRLTYNLNPSASTLNFILREKPFLVPTNTIWQEYNETVTQCGGSVRNS
ncbi:hypothetical protein [Lyngbya aestuarii]|uniref:hypothetical protein n=1 Tax=Lyngbya aestuarii TaxID=118322 RepID=UPI00403D606C